MAETLLMTKCIAPTLRPQLVPRPRLIEMLKRALDVPLTLVSAPPGFGKTTTALAAARVLQSRPGTALAWLSLDEHDNEPVRFWQYFAASLQLAAADPNEIFSAALAMPQSFPIQSLIVMVINEIARRPDHYLLVLDDYHLIDQSEIHNGLAFLLEHIPPNLHLLLATRADPPLSLHRLRARGQLVEIRAADLRFDLEESASFLTEVMALALTGEEIASLTEQTEGWVAGLQLAGIALQGTQPRPSARHSLIERLAQSNRYIMEYLAEEVLAQQPVSMQSFLLQTAILTRLCDSLCDAVTQRNDSREILDMLVRRNLFIVPVGAPQSSKSEQAWFRYHPLFADLLLGQLRQQQPELLPRLHQSAAGWYEKHGDAETAIEHALSGEDYPRAARLLNDHASDMVMKGRFLTIESWVRRLPESWRRTLPRANLAFAWALLMRGRYGEIEPYLAEAEASIRPEDWPLSAEFHALRASLADTLGHAEEALTHAQYALTHAAPDHLFTQAVAHTAMAAALRVMGDTNAAIAAYERAVPLCSAARLVLPEMLGRAHLGYLCVLQGRLHRAAAVTRPVADSPIHHPLASAAIAALGHVLLEWNRLDEAQEQIERAAALAHQSGHNAALVRVQTLLARLLRAQGDAAGAQTALDEASVRVLQGVPAWVKPLLTAERVQLWLDQDAVDIARQMLDEQDEDIDSLAGHEREVLLLTRARVLYRQHQHEEARTIVDDVLRAAEAGGRQGRVIEALLLRGLIHDAQGNEHAARSDLQLALALAEPESYVRVFLEAGAPLAAILTQVNSGYARHLLKAFPSFILQQAAAASTLPEPLTERETDVLRLMAQGLTYQQMADEMVVSINTVRHHVKGIYSKLGVETRTLALQRAQALNLL